MPFIRPTLSELVQRAQQDAVDRLELNSTPLRRAMVRVLARLVAGAEHMLHGHLDYLARQLFADLSEGPYLRRQASIFDYTAGVARFATGFLVVNGTPGAVVVKGTRFRRADDVEYVSTASVTVTPSITSIPVTAVLAGENGNLDAGAPVGFESPVAGVSAVAGVPFEGITGGADAESEESLRTRYLARLRQPPQGGAAGDYTVWALGVPGVTRVWEYPRQLGAGTVVVLFVRDNDASPIPSPGEVAEVQTYIDARRPVTAVVTVAAPVPVTWSPTIQVVPDTPATRAAVAAELADLFQHEGAPGVVLPVSRLRTAIGVADGVRDYQLQAPTSDLVHAPGQLPVLGSIQWQE